LRYQEAVFTIEKVIFYAINCYGQAAKITDNKVNITDKDETGLAAMYISTLNYI